MRMTNEKLEMRMTNDKWQMINERKTNNHK